MKSLWLRAELWVGLGAGLLVLPLFSFDFGFDQAVFATMADAMCAGQVLYRDAWEHKPPGVYTVFALAFACFGRDIWAVRILETLSVALTAAGLVRLMDLRFGTCLGGVMAGLSYGLLYLLMGGNSAQAEAFQIPFVVWGLVLWPRSADTEQLHWRCGGTGVLLSIALLFKSPIVLVPCVVGLDRLILDRRLQGWKAKLGLSGIFAAGLLLPGLLMAAYYAARGAFDPLMDALIRFPAAYAYGLNPSPLDARLVRALEWGSTAVPLVGIVLLLAGLILAGRVRGAETLRWGIVSVAALGAVILQGKSFPYHYYAVLPFVALGLGLAFAAAGEGRILAGLRVSAGVLAGLTLASLGVRSVDFWTSFNHVARYPRVEASLEGSGASNPSERELAAPILALTRPGDLIHVWGNKPLIYVLSDRRPGGRYIHLMQVLPPWMRHENLETLMERLEKDRTRLILVTGGPQWWARGKDSKQLLEESPEFRFYLRERYELRHRVGACEYWIRRLPEPSVSPRSGS